MDVRHGFRTKRQKKYWDDGKGDYFEGYWGEKTENGYIWRTNEEIYKSYKKNKDRLDNKSKKVAVTESFGRK